MKESKKTQVIAKDENFFSTQKKDLKLVRETMTQIMTTLADPSVTSIEKKNMLGVYNTINNSAKIMVSACITEIAIEKITPSELIEVKSDDSKEVVEGK